MNIWIDLTNSPQINFFKPFIGKWEIDGHEVIITCRDLANTIELIELNSWKYKVIGIHAGKIKFKKIIYFPLRILQLRKYLKRINPDIGISHSSFYSPVVARLLGIPSIYLNDNEHATGNYIAFMFASINLLPEPLKEKSVELNWRKRFHIDFYQGIKEGVYLSQMEIPKRNHVVIKKTKSIYIRLEPWTAQYYTGGNFFFDKLLKEIREEYHIVLLPRGKEQAKHYKSKEFRGINIPEIALNIIDIYMDCDLFIGAGGSMTREMAYLGIPTISIYQDKLLEVDKFLINQGAMVHYQHLQKKDIDRMIANDIKKVNFELKEKGNLAFELINRLVKEYGQKNN